MDLAGKLQIKPGMRVAVVAAPEGGPDLGAPALLTAAPVAAARCPVLT